MAITEAEEINIWALLNGGFDCGGQFVDLELFFAEI